MKLHEKTKLHKPFILLPFRCYYIPVVVLALIGLADSLYLAISHYRVHTDIGYTSFCALSRTINCDTVSSSPYAVFLNVPFAIWGIVGYAFVFFILVLAGIRDRKKQRLWPLLFWISLLYSLGSLALAGVSTFLIHSYCIMCIVSYLVNFTLTYYAWFVNRRFGDAGLFAGIKKDLQFLFINKRIVFPVFGAFLITISGLISGLPEYWNTKLPGLDQSLPKGITEDGHPWIGGKQTELEIIEFTDYLCPQCRIKHFYLRRLIANNPGKIKLIHRNFPMDNKFNPLVKTPYHVGSGVLALFSIYAAEHDKFWEANDMFFNLDRSKAINTKKIAELLNLDPTGLSSARYNRHILYKLQKEIEEGLSLGLNGTPAYIINGKVYQGSIPPHIIKSILE